MVVEKALRGTRSGRDMKMDCGRAFWRPLLPKPLEVRVQLPLHLPLRVLPSLGIELQTKGS